jgi:hypothetical protein
MGVASRSAVRGGTDVVADMTDDILARIPDLMRGLDELSYKRSRYGPTAEAVSEGEILCGARDALEAAQARIAELEAERDTARTILKASGDRVRELEAERDEWIRWSVEQDGVQTDNLIREKERAADAEACVTEREPSDD